MYYDGWGFWGMHFFWWLFWIVVLAVLFYTVTPVSRSQRRETPLDILQRRYAAGEIDTAEYEERKAKLERDVKQTK